MKAISVRQPWANLIIEGKKKLDLRTYKINFTGPLAIHASSIVELEDCTRFGFEPDHLPKGVVIGVVDLVEISELDKLLYEQREELHLQHRKYRSGLYGWLLKNPRALEIPIKYHGRQGVFNVPDELLAGEPVALIPSKMVSLPNLPWDPEKPFQLHVISDQSANPSHYRLAVYHPIINTKSNGDQVENGDNPELVKVVEISGKPLQLVSDHILDALRENDYKPTDLSPNRKKPFMLDEVDGVRLGLLFLAIKPISKLDRIEEISHEVRLMTVEELYYWFSKCTTEPTAERAQKALRVMLSAE
jgi:hypothetical protein